MILLIPILSIAILYVWVSYDKYVAEHYHFGGNLFGLLPIWEASNKEILSIFSRIVGIWLDVIISRSAWLLLLIIITGFICFFKSIHSTLRFMVGMTFAGVFLYILCWYKTFDVHDYYMINLFCLPLLLFYSFIEWIERKKCLLHPKFKLYFCSLISLVFFHSVYTCRAEQIYRYYGKDYNILNPAYYRIVPYLRSIGVNRDDRVVSVPDPSPNITLYLMNVIGYTECYTGGEYNVNSFIKHAPPNSPPVKYLIVGDTSYLRNPLYAPYCQPQLKVGEFEGIRIFRIERPNQ